MKTKVVPIILLIIFAVIGTTCIAAGMAGIVEKPLNHEIAAAEFGECIDENSEGLSYAYTHEHKLGFITVAKEYYYILYNTANEGYFVRSTKNFDNIAAGAFIEKGSVYAAGKVKPLKDCPELSDALRELELAGVTVINGRYLDTLYLLNSLLRFGAGLGFLFAAGAFAMLGFRKRPLGDAVKIYCVFSAIIGAGAALVCGYLIIMG